MSRSFMSQPASRRLTHRCAPARRLRLSTLGVMRGEAVKLRSVTSTWIGLATATVIHLVTTVSLVRALWKYGVEGDGKGFDLDLIAALRVPFLAGAPTVGWTLAIIPIIVVASLYGASEYTCSTAYSTYQAVPRRYLAIIAKTVCLGSVTAIFALVVQAVTMVAVQITIGKPFGGLFTHGAHVIWVTCLTTALSVAMVAVVTMELATLTRSTAIPISVSVVLMYLINPLLQAFSHHYRWLDRVQSWTLDRVQVALTIPYAPSGTQAGISAGDGLSAGTQALTGWWLVLATTLWILVPLALTVLVVEKRDVI